MGRLRGYGLTEEDRAETLEDARALYVVPAEVEIAAWSTMPSRWGTGAPRITAADRK
jgi:hypothetical protein